MQAYLARIAAVNPRHNAIVSLRDGDVLLRRSRSLRRARSRARDASAPPPPFLFGVPQAIKDIVTTAGIALDHGLAAAARLRARPPTR